MDEFSRKFDEDHKSVQMLQLADRVKFYNFNERSVQDELFARCVTKYSANGIMTFENFVQFLDDHMIDIPGKDQ